jgi:hypothetical protein
VIGDATATLQVSGTVVLAGGGMLDMSDSSGGEAPTDQLITGTAATDTLDNIDNTIGGYGMLGAGDGLLNFINAAAGTVDAATSTLIVNTGAHPVVNQGVLESTTGVLDLHGTITNTGGTIAAVGGTTELDGVTISGGTLATAGGVIASDGRATLNGSTSAVTLAPAAQAIVGGRRRQPADAGRHHRQSRHARRGGRQLQRPDRDGAGRRHGGSVRRRRGVAVFGGRRPGVGVPGDHRHDRRGHPR